MLLLPVQLFWFDYIYLCMGNYNCFIFSIVFVVLFIIMPVILGVKSSESDNVAEFHLGSEEILTTLYSYPNFQGDKKTLEETVEHYLSQTLTRDRTVNGKVDVVVNDTAFVVKISGDGSHIVQYEEQLNDFLKSGKLALKAVKKLKADNIWENDWSFFLPHGLSLTKQYSMQLLHFPPDYSLTGQDYLNSKTSKRWEDLLIMNDVKPDDLSLYETILDIAPIAAPSNSGRAIQKTINYFDKYILKMLPVVTRKQHIPIVAFGRPAMEWVSKHYKLPEFDVNSVETIPITDKINSPILGANHPSYIWYVKNESLGDAIHVMEEDLISACWQARMGVNHNLDNYSVLDDCIEKWQGDPIAVCINLMVQVYEKTKDEAIKECDRLPYGNQPPKTEL